MDDNEWETIHPPNSASTTTTHSDEDDGDAVVVVATPPNFNEHSIFPPSNHEGLPVFAPPQPQNHHLQDPFPASPSPPSSYSSSSNPFSSEKVEGEGPSAGVKAYLGILSSWVLRIGSRIGFWSIATVAAFVVVAVYGTRGRRWRRLVEKENRDQLMLVVKQKDEKIKQLCHQIDRMNEIISARQRVPVFRAVVDSPLLTAPRANWKPT